MRHAWRFVALSALGGCGQTQIATHNLELLQSLLTATGARKLEWVDAHAKKVDGLLADGKATADERAAFEPIYAAARAGDWDSAQKLARTLAAGQRLDRLADRAPRKRERRDPPTAAHPRSETK
jgi:hypothetical protein